MRVEVTSRSLGVDSLVEMGGVTPRYLSGEQNSQRFEDAAQQVSALLSAVFHSH